MNFTFTEEQLLIQKLMREFCAKEIAPGAAERDEKADFSSAYEIMMKKMAPLGLMSLWFPKEYGGLGLDYVTFALAGFELNKVEVGFGTAYSVQMTLGSYPLYAYGTEEQKQKWFVPLAKGEKLASFGLTEPNAGSDAAMQETTAVLDGDSYVLNGSKIYITNAGYSDIYTVFAMTDKSKGVKGISAFIVEKDTPGFVIGPESRKMGIRASTQRELYFENCRIPEGNLLGKEGEGFKIAMSALDLGRVGVAAQGVGVAMGALEAAVKYSKERVQFGKPISSQQAVAFMIADMACKVETARLLVLEAAWLGSQGLPYTKESAMAKLVASDTAMEVTTNAVQIFGGAGYLKDHPLERMMRDAKILQIYEGTNQIQRLVISGAILR
ncbi:MAG TPA: acyl-CoA dehydrogenase family protein [Anaerovoracaceae bacterium]|nr:acyl-CoA dehydrogenase family protein [Anaerovoracaceae bacterium]